VVPRTGPGTDLTVRLGWPDVGPREAEAVAEVLESGRLTMGPKLDEFEAELADACQVTEAVAVSSGTTALHLAMVALGIGPGDEVVVPAYTFPSPANAAAAAGARPVLVDVDAQTMDVDPERVAAAIGPRTRAVVAVHLFGRPVAWDALRRATPDSVALLEDAAGALGARWEGVPCGGLGRAGCLSFHPRKVVTTGEGGAVLTSEPELAATVRRQRHHGIEPGADFDIRRPGLNHRLSEVQCALGLSQLRRLDELLAARRRVAGLYAERLADLPVRLPCARAGDTHGWQAYVVQLDRRDEALERLRTGAVEAQIGTYALHHLSAYRDQPGPFPGADAAYERALALPLHSRVSADDVDRIAEMLAALW
jgi:perosamine synthetase